MFTMYWKSDYSSYKATYSDGWQRLNYCNAAFYHRVFYDDCTNDMYHIDKWYLNSYISPIMLVKRVYTVSDGNVKYLTFMLNEEQWRCSNTTIQHVSKFLKMLDHYFGIDVTYHDLKYWSNKTSDYYWYPMHVDCYDIEASILLQTRREMVDLFKAQAPMWQY